MEPLKILVVDDELGMRMGMQRSLANYKMKIAEIDDEISFNIDLAENGEIALDKIKNTRPDILLLDYKLPDLTGLEILEKIEPDKEELLTVMVTAYASLDTAVSAIKSGAFDFLAKPFTPNELRNTVSKAARNLIHAREIKKLNDERKRVRFQFISVLGHELKAPLSAVEGYLNMIKSRAVGDTITDYDQMVDRSLIRTDQMKKLIIDLLEMTKIESGQRQREIANINITDIVKTSIETMTPDAQLRKIMIELDCTDKTTFLSDKEEMEIIFNNLISNAVKYNKENGLVKISIKKSKNKLSISVKDSGIGISKDEKEKLFKEFVRIKNKDTKNILGSGLGLSTIKKITELYKGEITVDSVPQHGSTFKLILFE